VWTFAWQAPGGSLYRRPTQTLGRDSNIDCGLFLREYMALHDRLRPASWLPAGNARFV